MSSESMMPWRVIRILTFAFVMTPAAVIFPTFFEAKAIGANSKCYRFKSTETPDRAEVSTERSEVWCYVPVNEPAGSLLIFNADDREIRPELSALIEADGSITHGSLLKGQITVHKLKGGFNPLPVPLSPPANSEIVADPDVRRTEALFGGTLRFLLTQPVSQADLSVQPGILEGRILPEALPWRGYWWPYSSRRMYSGADSPMAKLDRFVKAYTGTNPGAQDWEKSSHGYGGVSWEGHCNGWAASAILRQEPRFAKRDPVSGVTFSVSDLKGLLAEKDYCSKNSFFGSRYRGRPGDVLKDIYAGEFHKTITYYIGQLQKPVVMDYVQGRAVDNNLVSGYKMTVEKEGDGTYLVTAVLQMHKYDKNPSDVPGTATSYKRTFNYRLWVDADGLISGSQWLSTNPDFLWIPLSTGDCSSSNPQVTERRIQAILAL